MQPDSFCSRPSMIERRRRADRAAVALVDVGTHDDVDEARLVLEREEDETLRRAGTLARDHHAADSADEMVRQLRRARCGEHAAASSSARKCAIGCRVGVTPVDQMSNAVSLARRAVRSARTGSSTSISLPSSPRASRSSSAAQRPHRFAPRSEPRRERAGDGEVLERFLSRAACAARSRACRRTAPRGERRFQALASALRRGRARGESRAAARRRAST